jgi:hypothetical protein
MFAIKGVGGMPYPSCPGEGPGGQDHQAHWAHGPPNEPRSAAYADKPSETGRSKVAESLEFGDRVEAMPKTLVFGMG